MQEESYIVQEESYIVQEESCIAYEESCIAYEESCIAHGASCTASGASCTASGASLLASGASPFASGASLIASGASPNPPSAVPWRSSRLGGAPIAREGQIPAISGRGQGEDRLKTQDLRNSQRSASCPTDHRSPITAPPSTTGQPSTHFRGTPRSFDCPASAPS